MMVPALALRSRLDGCALTVLPALTGSAHCYGNVMVVVVTGASAGVGRAVVREIAKKGAKIGLVARGLDGLKGARREVEAAGGAAMIVPADVAVDAQVEHAASVIEETLGPIDIWINNAMVSVFAPADEISPDEFRRVTEVTYLGYVWGTLAALRRMRRRRRGTIVQVGSALAYRSIPLQSAYCAAKHAIKGFTESLRTELLHDGVPIDLVMVHLPALNTPQFDWSRSHMPRRPQPVPPIFQPEIAARGIVDAALHPRREVLVGGTTALAIAAERTLPRVADRWLAWTAVDAQMTEERADPAAPHNLFRPVPGDHGAHGRFDPHARRFSLQAWMNMHRGTIALGVAMVSIAMTLVMKAHAK